MINFVDLLTLELQALKVLPQEGVLPWHSSTLWNNVELTRGTDLVERPNWTSAATLERQEKMKKKHICACTGDHIVLKKKLEKISWNHIHWIIKKHWRHSYYHLSQNTEEKTEKTVHQYLSSPQIHENVTGHNLKTWSQYMRIEPYTF